MRPLSAGGPRSATLYHPASVVSSPSSSSLQPPVPAPTPQRDQGDPVTGYQADPVTRYRVKSIDELIKYWKVLESLLLPLLGDQVTVQYKVHSVKYFDVLVLSILCYSTLN